MSAAFWYAGRGTGFTALVLLSLVVAMGIATRSGRRLPGLPRFAVGALHRSVSLLAVLFLALHVGTLLFDPYAQLRLLDIVVPFLGTYQPVWLGLGTVALDLILALVLTSLIRVRIGPRTWRGIHWLAYAAWPVALLHGLQIGSDIGTVWARSTVAGCVFLVLIALGWRLSPGFAAEHGRPRGLLSRRVPAPIAVPVPVQSQSRRVDQSRRADQLQRNRTWR